MHVLIVVSGVVLAAAVSTEVIFVETLDKFLDAVFKGVAVGGEAVITDIEDRISVLAVVV